MIPQRQPLSDVTIADSDDCLWAYVRASGALLQAHIHQLLDHEKELLQLIGRRISEKLSMVGALAAEDTRGQKTCHILLVDDHTKVRTALRMLLAGHDDMEVIGEACNGQQAVILTEACRPDVVVMDINMPGMNGITATGLIKKHRPETIVIGFSFFDDPRVTEAVLEAGASTLIPKHKAAEQLYAAIHRHWQQCSLEKGRAT